MKRAENRNMLWARVLVDELVRLRLSGVCIAPGSRSAPLAIAFAEREDLPHYVVIDERGAGYFGLGLALTTGRPAALLCTSGTASANFLPAVVEASQAGVPLLVITADRPSGLRDTGSNQTIDQVKLYGNYVRWYADAPAAKSSISAEDLRGLRTLADRMIAAATGARPGPVHLNIQFEKPLEPTLQDNFEEESCAPYELARLGLPDNQPLVEIVRGKPQVSNAEIRNIEDLVKSTKGIILCGPRCPGGEFPRAVQSLAKALGYPILADTLSGVRVHPDVQKDIVLGLFENYVKELPEHPDVILQFGGMPVSTRLQEYLAKSITAHRVLVTVDGTWADDRAVISRHLVTDPIAFCNALSDLSDGFRQEDDSWLEMWVTCEQVARNVINTTCEVETFEGGWVRAVVESVPDGALIFFGNSLPIRHADEFIAPEARDLTFFANRGASGIDGTLSTALGLAAGSRKLVVAVLGDLALLHDLNALMLIRKYGLDSKIVVVNNDGGGLFERLPISRFEPPFTEMFRGPHGLRFEYAARMFGLNYTFVPASQMRRAELVRAMESRGQGLIEIEGDAIHHERTRAGIHERIAGELGVKGLSLKLGEKSV